MNEIKLKVNFVKRTCIKTGVNLTAGDFGSTKILFEFDREDGVKIFEMANPDGEIILLSEIKNNELVLEAHIDVTTEKDGVTYIKYLNSNEDVFWYNALLNKLYDEEFNEVVSFDLDDYTKQYVIGSLFDDSGKYPFEISLYEDNSKLSSASSYLKVLNGAIDIENKIAVPYLPLFDQLASDVSEELKLMEESRQDLIDSKEEAETLINNFEADVEGYTNDFNTNATNKTSAFNQNATEKTTALNEIYEDAVDLKKDYDQDVADATSTLNGIVSAAESTYQAFDTNASEKFSAYNSNASSKLQDYNTNASSKESSFNSNATAKTTAFDNNATEKTTAFNTNATSKTTDFNTNASSKTTDFNTNATNKLDSYNSNATEKLQDYNDNADDKIDEFDEHAGEIQEEQVVQNKKIATLETVYNALPKVTGEGTDITLNGTANTKMDVELDPSELEQTTTTGKNLFNTSTATTTVNGITCTNNGDGTYTLDGTATDSVSIDFFSDTTIPSGTYKAIGCPPGGSASTYYIATRNDGVWGDKDTGNGAIITFTNFGKLSLSIAQGVTLTKAILKPMVTSDTSLTYDDFEPYTGGIASPNPDYPQTIHKITGNNQINIIGKNLFDKNTMVLSGKNINTGTNEVGSIASSTSVYIKCKTNTTYTVSKKLSSRFAIGTTQTMPDTGVSVEDVQQDNNATSLTITTNQNAKYIIAWVYTTTYDTIPLQDILDSVQIELGIVSSSYELYKLQSFSINLGDLEYCKAGNYEDRLFKNVVGDPDYDSTREEGKWYLKKVIDKVLLDGSEDENISQESTSTYIRFLVKNISNLKQLTQRTIAISNYFKYASSGNEIGSMFCWWVNNGTIYLYPSDSITTVSDFKDWLSNHNTIICYPIETPTYTLLNSTLQSQLDAIYEYALSYQEQTNISQVNNDLPFNIKASAVRDISAMFDTITNALLEIGGE